MATKPDNKWEWVGSIETVTGKHADLLNLLPEQIDIDDIATSLSQICRFNGHLPSFYSVAEHCVRVAWWLRDQQLPSDIILTGLLHDASEAYVGDMMRPLKRLPSIEAVFKPIEDQVMETIHKVLGGVFPHPEVVHKADYETYVWETLNIRTSNVVGWSPDLAKEIFLDTLYDYSNAYLFNSLDVLLGLLEDDQVSTAEHAPFGNRRALLNEAAELVDGDRNAQYGDPIDDFRRTSIYWSTHIGGVFRRKMNSLGHDSDESVLYVLDNLLDPHDVAIMMSQLKDSRLAWDPYKKDSWVDKAGYDACGYDCVIRED